MRDALATAAELTELYGEALSFYDLSPHLWLKTNQLIVVQDPETDVLGYCALEKKEDSFELSVHLGNDGLKSYLNGKYSRDSENGLFNKNCLHLSYNRLHSLEADDFASIEKMDFNFSHKGELPKFRNYTTGFLPEALKSGWQSRFLTEVLKQLGLIVAEMKQNSENLALNNDEVILCIHTPTDEWTRLKVPMQVFLNQINESRIVYQNDLEAYRINRLPVMDMMFEVTQFYVPTAVKKTHLSRGFYPFVTAAFETSTKQIIFAEITDSRKESMETVLAKFAKTILNDLQFKPKYLVSDSEAVLECFQDFCHKTNIKAETVPTLETAKGFISDLMNIKDEEELGAITFSAGFEEEIDEVLETARSICDTILKSSLLNNKLDEIARQQFTSIVELLHVVMMSNFKELPDSWTPKHVEQALQTIFPSLLTEEEMKFVPDILYYFVEIVGEAQMLPNYFEIKDRIQAMYNVTTKKQHG